MSEISGGDPRLTPPTWRGGRPLHLRYDNAMYQRIVGLDSIPEINRPPKGPGVEVSIETDNVIKVDEWLVSAIGHKLFVLNALLTNLGRTITRRDVEELGFAPDASGNVRQKEFSLARKLLEEELLYGQPAKPLILQKFGAQNRAHYQLDPRLEYVFYDRRTEQI